MVMISPMSIASKPKFLIYIQVNNHAVELEKLRSELDAKTGELINTLDRCKALETDVALANDKYVSLRKELDSYEVRRSRSSPFFAPMSSS